MTSSLSTRDRRLVLVIAGAAVVWRWLVAMRTPLPGLDAAFDLWLANQLAHGTWADLGARAAEPWSCLLLAPAIALGASPWLVAQVTACLLGGLVVVPVAAAAERLRQGAGLPAAVLAMVAAGPVVAAGAGASVGIGALFVALATWAVACGRTGPALLCAALAAATLGERLLAVDGVERTLRLSIGCTFLLAPLAGLPPRPRPWLWLALAYGASLTIAVATRPMDWLPTWSPLAAVLAGVGLARLSTRWREVLLCVVVAVECHAAWQAIEPRHAVAERAIGRFVARRLPAGTRVLSDLPRVLWAAGQRPEASPAAELVDAARSAEVAAVVLGPEQARSSTVAASLAGSFARYELPTELVDLATAAGLRVLIRR